MTSSKLKIASYELGSRLIIGTGKYPSPEIMVKAHEASGAEMVTVAVARVNLDPARREKTFLDYIDREKYTILPNTAGAYTAEEALRIARLARAAGLGDLIKLEVLGYQKTLLDVRRVLREGKGISLSKTERQKWAERILMLSEKIRPLAEDIQELKLQIRLKKQKIQYLR